MFTQTKKLLTPFLLLLSSTLVAQVKEPQAGDTTYYKTLIPETKQTLLRSISMIANMRFAQRHEFLDGKYTQPAVLAGLILQSPLL